MVYPRINLIVDQVQYPFFEFFDGDWFLTKFIVLKIKWVKDLVDCMQENALDTALGFINLN